MELFSHAATVLPVRDMQTSLDFYTRQLGFSEEFLWQSPPTYAVLVRGGVSIHLSLLDKDQASQNRQGMVYLFVHDVEAVYQEYRERAVPIASPLAEQDYQMKDFDIRDPDGHVLIIGQGNG